MSTTTTTTMSTNAPNLVAAAHRDTQRIVANDMVHISVDTISPEDARLLMSEEHKILGYRPPPHSLASNAQSAAAKHGSKNSGSYDPEKLRLAALEDANKIKNEQARFAALDLDKVGAKDARRLMSEEHKALGYRPPPGSLAAQAQRSSVKHPDASTGLDPATLKDVARLDAEKIEAERVLNLKTLSVDEAHKIQSEEQKSLGYRPPPGSLAAEAQSAVDKRDQEPVTKEMAAEVFSEEHRKLGHQPPSGSFAATVQSVADHNEELGTSFTLKDTAV